MTKLTKTEATQVFRAAIRNGYWTRTNMGHVTDVDHGGHTYKVRIPHTNHLAVIDSRRGWGGLEHITGAVATRTQHASLAAAAGA